MSRNSVTYRRNQNSGSRMTLILIVAMVTIVAIALFSTFQACSASSANAPDAQAESGALSGEAASLGGADDAQFAWEDAIADNVVLTLGGSRDTYVLAGEEYLEAGCHAVQKDAGDITSSVEISGDVDASVPGDYEVTYTATNSDGAKAQIARNVHVVESFDGVAASVPVLMYHYVYDESAPPESVNGNYLLNTKLAEQCAYLKESGYYYPSYQELRAFVEGEHTLPAKSVVLTFDDGEQGFLDCGIPVLEEYGVPATSFVVAKDAGSNVIDYASEYVQFQSHSYNMHRAGGNAGQGGIIHALSEDEIYEDVMKSNEVTGGDGAVALAYPFGDNNEDAWAALDRAGVLCAFTVKNDRIHSGDNPLALNRVRISSEYSLDSFKTLVAPDVA